MVRHRPSEQYRRRIEDDSFWFKGLYYLEKFAILWIPLTAIISGIGFTIITPKMQINAIQASITEVKDTLQHQIDINKAIDSKRADSVIVLHKDLETEIRIMLKLACVNPQITTRDRTLVGLDCVALSKLQ